MATEQSLTTLLRALQSASSEQDISRLLGSATSLYTLLSNPSNVTLLTSQILTAPAIWGPSTDLKTVVGVINLFRTASYLLLRRQKTPPTLNPHEAPRGTSLDRWIFAVIKGADIVTPPSRQVLVLSGLLQGLQNRGRNRLSTILQDELVKSANTSLRDDSGRTTVADRGLIVAIAQVFDLLDLRARRTVNHDLLLPILIHAVFFSEDGIHSGYFLGKIDADVVESEGQNFAWSVRSNSYLQLQSTASGSLVADLGRLSRLAAFSIGQAVELNTLKRLLQDLYEMSRSLCIQWRQNKLSEIDVSEETVFLADETIKTSLPLLWRLLRSSMFAVVVTLAAYTGRSLSDNLMAMSDGPSSAIQVLNILRNLYFISSRIGTDTLSQYSFVYLAAVDVISLYPMSAEAFLTEIRPTDAGAIPRHPLDRCLDLYFLNTAELFTPFLSTQAANDLLITTASPYLGMNGDYRSLEIFEAAHSVMLAMFTSPNNINLTASRLEAYIQLLFEAFPQSLSPRQFRLAIRQLVRLSSPPSLISAHWPLLPSTILEIVRLRIAGASSQPLASLQATDEGDAQPMTEQAVLILALIDSLLVLQLDVLDDWLWISARLCCSVQDPAVRHACIHRLWEVLSNGEMDVDQAALCVNWWHTEGGRELVLHGEKTTNAIPLIDNGGDALSKL